MTQSKSYNELVYKIAERVKVLANEPITALKLTIGTADTYHGAQKESKHKNRGVLIEDIVLEEFIQEFDVKFED